MGRSIYGRKLSDGFVKTLAEDSGLEWFGRNTRLLP